MFDENARILLLEMDDTTFASLKQKVIIKHKKCLTLKQMAN